MTLKYDLPGEEVTVIHRQENGLTRMAHPDAEMRRASHALATDEDIWLVDPLDAEDLDAELPALGTVAGVAVLTNSHDRYADRLAERHDVAIHVSACFDDPASDFDAPVETFDDELGDTGFELIWETARSGWQEGTLYHPDRRTLVVADALTTTLFTEQDGRLEFFRSSGGRRHGRRSGPWRSTGCPSATASRFPRTPRRHSTRRSREPTVERRRRSSGTSPRSHGSRTATSEADGVEPCSGSNH